MVPFFTLGLPPEMARDGWGNYFTYAVSPVFARHNIETSTIDAGDVHGRCRHQGWTGIEPGIDDRTRNAVKARFCCMDQRDPTYAPNTDLIIRHADGTLLSPTRGADGNLIFPSPTPPPPTSPPGADRIYANVHIRTSSLVPPDDISVPEAFNSGVLAPAFVLVSHGEDGFGAYLANGSTNRVTTGTGSPTQQENSGGDFRIFVDGPPDRAGNNYFDDIVRWMTQDGLIAAHGALSCQYP